MEEEDNELAQLSADTQAVHSTIRASNKLTATMYNVQQSAHRLKLLCQTRWGSMCDLFNSHVKASTEIHEVSRQYSDRVSDRTVSQAFLKKMRKHTIYLNHLKTVSATLQARHATLADCQDALDLLDELIQEGRTDAGNDFEHCLLQGDRYLVGNSYDSGKILCFAMVVS